MRSTISLATHKGSRGYQEDRNIINQTENGILLAVFDGHGGDEVSDFCEKNILRAFNDVADNNDMPTIPLKIKGIFDFLARLTNDMRAGSTASIVFIPSTMDRAFVGVLGDSPVIIKNKDNEYWIAPEHNVRSNPKEVEEAKKRGGFIHDGYLFGSQPFGGGLQMSRALGDASLSDVLNREPEVFEQTLGAGSFVLVGSDGLLDPSHKSGSAASAITTKIESGEEAPTLVKWAVSVPTNDNVTALLVRIRD